MKKIVAVVCLAVAFLFFFQEKGSAKIDLAAAENLCEREIRGTIDLFEEPGPDDYAEEMIVGGYTVVIFFKIIKTGVPRSGIRRISIIAGGQNSDGKYGDTLSREEFNVRDNGDVVIPIGFTLNKNPYELITGEFRIKIWR